MRKYLYILMGIGVMLLIVGTVSATINYLLTDNFTGNDGDDPDPSKWNIVYETVDIRQNRMRFYVATPDYVEVDTIGNYGYTNITMNFTINFTSSLSSFNQMEVLFRQGQGALRHRVYLRKEANKVQCDTGITCTTRAYTFNTNQIYNISISHNSGQVRVYIDNVLVVDDGTYNASELPITPYFQCALSGFSTYVDDFYLFNETAVISTCWTHSGQLLSVPTGCLYRKAGGVEL